MRKLAVIGLGSAGVQTLCHFLCWLNGDWEITSIHDPKTNILGIGESTNPPFINSIEWGLDFEIVKDLNLLDGTLKYGTKYTNWREHEFVNPLLSGNVAAHINTFKLKDFALPRLRSIWGSKFKELEGEVLSITDNQDSVTLNVDETYYDFDCVIVCTGFPKNLTEENYNIVKNQQVNHALVHNKPPKYHHEFEPTYTGHIATEHGWMFEVPLSSRTSYGYLFNDTITTIGDAKKNFSQIIDVPLDQLQNIEYNFNSYYKKEIVNGRVFYNGNQALFFEPLFANSLWMYDKTNRFIFDYISQTTTDVETNNKFTNQVKQIEEVIAYHYHGGSTFDTDFWKYAKTVSTEKLRECEYFNNVIIPALSKYKTENFWGNEPQWLFGPKQLTKLDKNFGYNYFNENI